MAPLTSFNGHTLHGLLTSISKLHPHLSGQPKENVTDNKVRAAFECVRTWVLHKMQNQDGN